MSKSTYQNIRAQQRRITKRTNLFISQHNKLVNIGMAVFFLLLLFVATGLPSKITRSIQGSKPTNEASTISSNAQKATIDKKNPASTATPAAAPPTPAQTTNTQPSYVAPLPIATPTLTGEQYCLSVSATIGGRYSDLYIAAIKVLGQWGAMWNANRNTPAAAYFGTEQYNQKITEYNNYVDQIYFEFSAGMQAKGCSPDRIKPTPVELVCLEWKGTTCVNQP